MNAMNPAAHFDTAAATPVDGRSYARGGPGRVNWAALVAIVVAHLALLTALVVLDVIPITRKPAKTLTIVDIQPLPEATPPPPAVPQPQVKPVDAVVPPPTLTAPPPVVVVPVSSPIQVAAPVPPVPVVVAAPAPAAPAPPAEVIAPTSDVGEFGNAPPKYPPLSLRLREQGMVRLRVVIDALGHVRDIVVAKSSGFERLDKAALAGIRQWRFHPGKADGRVLDEAIGYLNYTFALRG